MIAALFCGLFYGAFILSAVQEMERIRRRERAVEEIEAIMEFSPSTFDIYETAFEPLFKSHDCSCPEPHNCTCDPCTCHESTTITHTGYVDG